MRKLMYFSLGFGIACGVCAYILTAEHCKIAACAALFLCAAAALLSRDNKVLRRMAFLLLGCAAGFGWFIEYDAHYLSCTEAVDGEIKTAVIRASDFSYETAYGAAVDGTLSLRGKDFQITAYLNEPMELEPGDTVSGDFLFRVTAPDAREESVYHQGKGIFLLAYQRGDITVTASKETWVDRISRVRREIRNTLQATFPLDTSGFATALLLGDSSGIDYKTDTNFKLSGIRHVIAVSGLHVFILVALVSAITFRKRFLTALIGFPVLFLFAALAGFSPSVTRACIMSALMMLAVLAGREYDGATALSFAALVMLVLNPLVITSVSFQLSVGSVAGIYLFNPPIRKWLLGLFGERKRKKVTGFFVSWICTSVSVTLSAMSITTPLSAVYFGTVSLVSVITNLLTLWIISCAFYGILAVCLLASVWMAGAALVAKVISIPIRYVLVISEILADVPLAAVYTRSPYIAAWLVFVYILLLLFLLMKKKRPSLLLSSGVLGLCVALLASWVEPMTTDLRFSVLDVGQGQCLLMQYQGNTVMVDCGGDSDTRTADIAAETLLSQGITKLDCLILTHLDRDHAGAAGNFLSRIDTELLILPPVAAELTEYAAGQVVYAAENLHLACGAMDVEIFVPNFPGNSNEMSLCILFDTEKCDILITGDRNGFGERSLLRNNAIGNVDILIAGHHGSKNSTSEELLQAVGPEIVCISVGADNSYGHPAPELLQRLADRNCTVYRTDQQGTILIRR